MKVKKTFRGIKLMPLELRANRFDGYGLTLLQLQVSWKRSDMIVTTVENYALFSFNYFTIHFGYKGTGKKRVAFLNICSLFKKPIWEKLITEPKPEDEIDWDDDGWLDSTND